MRKYVTQYWWFIYHEIKCTQLWNASFCSQCNIDMIDYNSPDMIGNMDGKIHSILKGTSLGNGYGITVFSLFSSPDSEPL